jgi:acyl-CoA thioesterase
MGLADLLATAEQTLGGLRLTIPENWHQGRTAYGGLSASLALAAARQAGGANLPPLRSAQVSFVGPVFGEIEARARVLRRGRNAVFVAAELLRQGEVVLATTFVFMAPVESKLHFQSKLDMPGLILVDEGVTRPSPPGVMQFFEHMEVRFAVPPRDEVRPEVCWWIRARDRAGIDPELELLFLADMTPPGVLPLLEQPIPPISSMTWLANFLSPAPQTRDGWWLLRTTGDYAENGCSSDRTEVWNTDGQPMLIGMQSVAIFG